MSELEMPEKDSILFSYKLSAIVSAEIAKQYSEGLATMCTDKNTAYLKNKCIDLGNDCTKVINEASRGLKSVTPLLDDYISSNIELIYSVIGLDIPQRKRVQGLISKLQKEAQNGN